MHSPLAFALFPMALIFVTAEGQEKPMEFEQVLLGSTFADFKEEVASRFGSSAFRLYLGSQYCKGGETLGSKWVVDGTSLHLTPFADKEARGKKRIRTGETKRSKYAALMGQGVKIQEAVDDVAVTQQSLLGGQAKAQADLTAIRAAIEPIQPTIIPGELELMEQILDKLKVARMNSLLVHWGIAHPRGVKKNGKARLLAQKAPLAELQQVLRDSATSGNADADGPLGLDATNLADFHVRLAAQVAHAKGQETLDELPAADVAGAVAAFDAGAIIAQEEKDPDHELNFSIEKDLEEMMNEEAATQVVASSSSDAPALGA